MGHVTNQVSLSVARVTRQADAAYEHGQDTQEGDVLLESALRGGISEEETVASAVVVVVIGVVDRRVADSLLHKVVLGRVRKIFIQRKEEVFVSMRRASAVLATEVSIIVVVVEMTVATILVLVGHLKVIVKFIASVVVVIVVVAIISTIVGLNTSVVALIVLTVHHLFVHVDLLLKHGVLGHQRGVLDSKLVVVPSELIHLAFDLLNVSFFSAPDSASRFSVLDPLSGLLVLRWVVFVPVGSGAIVNGLIIFVDALSNDGRDLGVLVGQV